MISAVWAVSFPRRGTLVNALVVKYIKRLVPKYHLPDAISFRSALQHSYRMQYISRKSFSGSRLSSIPAEQPGEEKGAMLTHRNMLANLNRSTAPTDRCCIAAKSWSLPRFCITFCADHELCSVVCRAGRQNLLITNPRDIPGLVKELAKIPFTAMTGVNSCLTRCSTTKSLSIDFSSCISPRRRAVQQVVAERWVVDRAGSCLKLWPDRGAPLVSRQPARY